MRISPAIFPMLLMSRKLTSSLFPFSCATGSCHMDLALLPVSQQDTQHRSGPTLYTSNKQDTQHRSGSGPTLYTNPFPSLFLIPSITFSFELFSWAMDRYK